MKRNLPLEENLIMGVIERSISGITGKEINELKKLCNLSRYEYYNRIKLRYLPFLSSVRLNYKVTQELEETVFFYIHEIIHQITSHENDDTELTITLSLS